MRLLSILFFTVLSLKLSAQKQTDHSAIIETLNNYVDGFYKGDADKLKKALKPRLYKFGFLKDKSSGEYKYYEHMTFDSAIEFANKMSAEGRSRDENTIRKVEVLDISNHIASAKVTAVWGIDYLLLSKDNEQWQIEEVIWEGPYELPKYSTNSTTTIYLIRHAEKNRTDPTNKDPELTNAGKKRAVDLI